MKKKSIKVWAVVPTAAALKTGIFEAGVVPMYGVSSDKEMFDQYDFTGTYYKLVQIEMEYEIK